MVSDIAYVAFVCTLKDEGVDDIVRARLRTLGVEEHRFTMESGEKSITGVEYYRRIKHLRSTIGRGNRLGMVHIRCWR